MKVKITGSDHQSQWYSSKTGDVFSVIPYPKDKDYWQLPEKQQPHITRLIRKDHCAIVNE